MSRVESSRAQRTAQRTACVRCALCYICCVWKGDTKGDFSTWTLAAVEILSDPQQATSLASSISQSASTSSIAKLFQKTFCSLTMTSLQNLTAIEARLDVLFAVNTESACLLAFLE